MIINHTVKDVEMMGMLLKEWTYESCTAHIAVGDNELGQRWATVYDIESTDEGKGHARELLTRARDLYTGEGRFFGSTIALHPAMKHLLHSLHIHEYTTQLPPDTE